MIAKSNCAVRTKLHVTAGGYDSVHYFCPWYLHVYKRREVLFMFLR